MAGMYQDLPIAANSPTTHQDNIIRDFIETQTSLQETDVRQQLIQSLPADQLTTEVLRKAVTHAYKRFNSLNLEVNRLYDALWAVTGREPLVDELVLRTALGADAVHMPVIPVEDAMWIGSSMRGKGELLDRLVLLTTGMAVKVTMSVKLWGITQATTARALGRAPG